MPSVHDLAHVFEQTVTVKNNNNNINNNNITLRRLITETTRRQPHQASPQRQTQAIIPPPSLPSHTMPPTAGGSPPDFDFNMQCRLFQSSFARTLALNNASDANDNELQANPHQHQHQCRSLDFDINYTNANGHNIGMGHTNTKDENTHGNAAGGGDIDAAFAEAAVHTDGPPLPQRQNRVKNANAVNGNRNANSEDANAKPPALPVRLRAADAQQQHHYSQQQQQQTHAHSLPPCRRLSLSKNVANSNKSNNYKHHLAGPTAYQTIGALPPLVTGDFLTRYCWNGEYFEQREFKTRDDYESENEYESIKMPQMTTGGGEGGGGEGCGSTSNAGASTTTTTTAAAADVNVEAVILQKKLVALEWQLQQVETRGEMFRTVMEEVLRFFERYRRLREQPEIKTRQLPLADTHYGHQISRSKSLHHVYEDMIDKRSTAVEASNGQPMVTAMSGGPAQCSDHYDCCIIDGPSSNLDLKANGQSAGAANSTSYNTFKDFTWRRSPKKPHDAKANSITGDAEEKLQQEAFRLSRTIQSLLSISSQQPDLTHNRSSSALGFSSGGFGRLASCKTPTNSTMTLHIATPSVSLSDTSTTDIGSGPAATVSGIAVTAAATAGEIASRSPPPPPPKPMALASEMLFLRAAATRDSRNSMRSCTDSSVHSTISSSAASSSSKVETDEEATAPLYRHSTPLMPIKRLPQTLSSATEDESGFSSISSFQDVGLPLSSTMIAQHNTLPRGKHITVAAAAGTRARDPNSSSSSFSSIHRHNSTLKPITTGSGEQQTLAQPPPPLSPVVLVTNSQSSTHPNNVVGVPLQATHNMQHRWDSPAKTHRRSSDPHQRFSTLSTDDPNSVLWV